MFFDNKFSNLSDFLYLEPGFHPSLIQETQNHSEKCIKVEVSRRTQKVEIYLQMKHLVFRSLEGTGDTYSVGTFAKNLVWCWDEKDLRTKICLQHDWVQYRWQHENPIAAVLSFHFKAQTWRNYNYWTVFELSDIQQPAIQITARKFSSYYSHWLERHEWRKTALCVCRYHSFCFDVQKASKVQFQHKKR